MIKILIGGSPCTYWSVAQKKGREVEAEGLGWELFRNYLIAKEKFKPDFFLYENNKSAAQPIKDQISHELGVDLMHINSALVSAQNRQRFYAFNWNVDQPADRGIMLKDILDETEGEPLTLKTRIDAMLSRMACHGSIRHGRQMRADEMNALLREMEATPLSGQCNHGRPTFVELKLADIERLFGRR